MGLGIAFMPTYRFEAMSASGEEFTDVIEAASEREAKQQLSHRKLFVTKLTATSSASEPYAVATAKVAGPSATGQGTSLTPELIKRHAREKRAMGAGFVVMGLLVLLFGAWMACDAVPFVRSAVSTTGVCIGQAYDSSDNDYSIPIIEIDVGGTKHRVESRGILGMRFKSGYTKGHRMTVMYPPGHPDEARVGGVIGNLQFPLAFLAMGNLFAIAGVWLTNIATRRA